MAQLEKIKTKEGSIELLFGIRILKNIKKYMGITDLAKLAEKFEDYTEGDSVDVSELMDFVAGLLWVAHENACFFKREAPVIEDSERMFFVIDEIGIDKAAQLAFDGFTQMMASEKTPSAPTKKKGRTQSQK